MKGQDLLGAMIVFFIVFIVVGLIMTNILGSKEIGFIIGLFAGFIVCGGGSFLWSHRS